MLKNFRIILPSGRISSVTAGNCLIASKGKSIVVSGTNDVEIQILVNGINYLLGNYKECIDLNKHLNIASGIDSHMDRTC